MFSKEVTDQLAAPLDASRVATREGGRDMSLSYLLGYDVIDAANRIFGYAGWGLEVKEVRELREGWYVAVVTVGVADEDGRLVTRSDVGFGAALPNKNGGPLSNDEVDKAVKSAVTDAMKRAFRTFGNQFGNSLYDKDSPLHKRPAPANGRGPAQRTQGFRTFAG